jgi:hypothetical protein
MDAAAELEGECVPDNAIRATESLTSMRIS